ncbi:hypothetical protein KIW84_053201 [Lathyrus oleraceus]|uniref:Putative plant transposon protein domain-containing protein n=1 Tax=Pisum sativum TaxID=3888 RepID=A0A9D4WQW9_PEA|nr:hypothetical protein KIW84_053201 [Pisum sativum]
MASQLQSKGKGKASSSRGPLDLSRLFTTKSQQERYEKYFFQTKIMKPKYGSFVSFSDDVFSFPTVFENLGLSDLICYPDDFYPKLVKVFYSNMVTKKGKLTSVVKEVPISMKATKLSSILGIPTGGHKFVGTKAPWEDYSKHAFYYGLSHLSEHQFYNKRKKSLGGDLPERVYLSPTKFTLDDRMLHYFLVYVTVPRFSNHCTITDPEMMLLYAIKNNFRVDWGHTIITHMMSHNEHADDQSEDGSYINHRTHEIKYLDNDDEENQPEVPSDEEINPPSEAQPIQPFNQMIMEYLQGFQTDVMTEIGHLSSRMDRWELSQGGFQGGGSNDGNDQ